MRSSLALGTLAALLLVPTTWADKIYTADGKVIEDVTIVEEQLAEVLYKEGRNDRQIASEKVMRVEFESEPRVFGTAAAYLDEGDVESAIGIYSDYVESIISGNGRERRHKWGPANAAWRIVGLSESIGDRVGAAAAAGKLIASFPDSRYLPSAYMAKADAEFWSGDSASAQKTLAGFKFAIEKGRLSERWAIECELGLIETNDKMVGAERRTALDVIAERAGEEFITVKNRAYVGIGESNLADVTMKRGDVAKLLADAQTHFEAVIGDPLADDSTLAGAYAGLGDCLFAASAKSGDKAGLKRALLSFLRVQTNYPEQGRYVSKSLFYAGRCFDLIDGEGDSDRAQQLYGQVYFGYPDTKWAKEAKNFSKRR